MTRASADFHGADRPQLRPIKAARELGVSEGLVLRWIKSGALPASDVSRRAGSHRARGRVSRKSFEEFLLRRQCPQAIPPVKRRRRRDDDNYIRYYPD
jgi:hypothetical protein